MMTHEAHEVRWAIDAQLQVLLEDYKELPTDTILREAGIRPETRAHLARIEEAIEAAQNSLYGDEA